MENSKHPTPPQNHTQNQQPTLPNNHKQNEQPTPPRNHTQNQRAAKRRSARSADGATCHNYTKKKDCAQFLSRFSTPFYGRTKICVMFVRRDHDSQNFQMQKKLKIKSKI